jgi:hypothetical protein
MLFHREGAMGDRGQEFANIVYTILVVEKRPRVEDAARALGMSYATLHSRLIARTCFSPDEVRDLVRAVPDPRLLNYVLDGTSFLAAERPRPGEPEPAIERGATKVVIGAADVLEIIDAGIAGGGLDRRQEVLVLSKIDETERALASLRLQLQSVAR